MQIGEDLRQRQQTRSGVEAEAVPFVHTELAAGHCRSFVHLDLVPRLGQPDRRGQPADACTDHHDPAHTGRPRQLNRPRRRSRKDLATSAPNSTIDTGWANASGNRRPPLTLAATTRPTTPRPYATRPVHPHRAAPGTTINTAATAGTAYSR